jgi:hypothetical protein
MTYVTSKGETVNSTMTDAHAVEILVNNAPAHNTFAQSLIAAWNKGKLTENQRPYLHKLANQMAAPKIIISVPAPVAAFSSIVALLTNASKSLKFPKITLDQDGKTLRLSLAGNMSKHTGNVMVTDGKAFGQNTFYGRITPDGTFVANAKVATDWIVDVLTAFAANPTTYVKLYGIKTGNCCFCAKELSTTESVTVGYGPVCAKKWGLPWG